MWTLPQKARQRVNEELQSLQNNRCIWSLKLRLCKPSPFALITIYDSEGSSLYKLPLIHCMSITCWDKDWEIKGEWRIYCSSTTLGCLFALGFLPFFSLPLYKPVVWFVCFFSGRLDNTWLLKRRWLMLTASNLSVSAAKWHLVIMCCLPLKTQQYFANVGQWMWKQLTKKLKN